MFVLDWESATQPPWGIVLLFGGGLSLAAATSGNRRRRVHRSAGRGVGGLPAIQQMARTGIILNGVGIVLITLVMVALAGPVLGVSLSAG